MNKVLISVCIPIYGVEKYIEKCARSLFEQTLTEGIEFIFVNDCTPDNSVKILQSVLEEYPERLNQVKIISAKTNGGLATARNIALSQAKGEYIIHCDSDDWVDLDMYDKLLDRAIATDADIVMCDFIYEYRSKTVPTQIPTLNTSVEYVSQMLEGKIHCGTWNKLVKRKLYDINNISFPDGINMWEDINTIIPLTYCAKKIEIVSKPLYHYRQTNMQSYTQSVSRQSLNNMKQTISRLEKLVNSLDDTRLKKSLNYLKLTAKLNMLIGTHGKEQKKYTCLYPESNKYIMSYSIMSPFWRLGLWCVSHSQLYLFNLLRFIKAQK